MQFFFPILLLLPLSFNAIGQVTGKVFDQKTGNPIYGVVVTNEEGEFVSFSDREGMFFISEIDGLFILSALGYKNTTIKLSNINDSRFLEIGLIPKAYVLPEIFITDQHGEAELFSYKKRRLRTFNFFSIGPTVSGSLKIGTRFYNQSSGVISSVSVYFTEVGLLTDYQLLRLRIFELNHKGEPEEDLLNSLVVLRPKNPGWYDIDLSKKSVPLLGTDFLVAIEFIQRRYDKSEMKYEIYSNPFDLGFTRLRPRDRSEALFYYKTNKSEWLSFSWPSLPLIQVEAIFDHID